MMDSDSSIVYLGTQARKNLEIFSAIGVFPLIRDLNIFVTPLLLRLSYLNPLFSCEMLTKLGKDILRQPKPVEKRTIRDRIQNNVVIWATAS